MPSERIPPTAMREGFWRQTGDGEADLFPKLAWPMPVKPWPTKDRLVEVLTQLMKDNEPFLRMKGFSYCRLCGCFNGTTEYYIRGWQFPEGLLHYIRDHNVRPSLAFEETFLGDLF